MNLRLLDDLVCPLCSGSLVLDDAPEPHVEHADITCTGCGAVWSIRNGVPRLVPPDLTSVEERTASAFGWQWKHFSEMHPEFEAQFLDWIHPLEPGFFKGKRVLDAGCGTGRHAYFAASYGAREVVALDLSVAVDAARENLREFENVEIVQGDLLRPPFRTAAAGGGFDLIYSIGVLHHLPNPYEGFTSLLRYLRPGGTIAVWVYGYENNGVVRNVVEPLRRVSTKVSASATARLGVAARSRLPCRRERVYRPLRKTPAADALPSERVHVERCRLQLSSELRHRVRPALSAVRRLHQGPGAA